MSGDATIDATGAISVSKSQTVYVAINSVNVNFI